MLEKTRLRYVAFAWQRCLGRLLLRHLIVLVARPEAKQTRRPRRPFRRRQADVGRIGRQFLNVPKQLLGSVGRIETESGNLSVIGGRPHRVEGRSGRFVVAQIVDRVAPQSESSPAFGQDQLDSPQASRFRPAQVQQHDRNSSEFQLPIGQPVRLSLQRADANIRLTGTSIQTHQTFRLS